MRKIRESGHARHVSLFFSFLTLLTWAQGSGWVSVELNCICSSGFGSCEDDLEFPTNHPWFVHSRLPYKIDVVQVEHQAFYSRSSLKKTVKYVLWIFPPNYFRWCRTRKKRGGVIKLTVNNQDAFSQICYVLTGFHLWETWRVLSVKLSPPPTWHLFHSVTLTCVLKKKNLIIWFKIANRQRESKQK